MTELRDLYQSVILDHYRQPRNRRKPEGANRVAEGVNPLCGDQVRVFVKVEDGVVRDIGFEGTGCAVSTASASLMTESVKGKPVEEAEALFRRFHEYVTSDRPREETERELGKLRVFGGVREFPSRIKCATLVWHALDAALHGRREPVSTE